MKCIIVLNVQDRKVVSKHIFKKFKKLIHQSIN